jgi:prepilin-type N-terminal cleavage/methylation domain-containing protein
MLSLRCAKQQKAFTLVEVLIALVILAIALLALAGVVISTTMLLSHSIDREKAVSLAGEKLDELEGEYDDIVDSTDTIGKFIRTWTVTEISGIKTVNLTMTWPGIIGERSLTMEREYAELQ